MSETNTPMPVAVLPTVTFDTLLQPVSSMLRNCLITANPKLKELDFSHLQMYIPVMTESETTVPAQVLVKAGSDSRYRLESKQVFQYTRINADEGLANLGLTDRTFDKPQFNDVSRLLSGIGTLTVIDGDLNAEQGDAIVSFVFGNKYQEFSPARFIDLGSDNRVKADYDVAFHGTVRLTFKGLPVPVTEQPTTTDEDEGALDIAPFFLNTHLGQVFKSGSNAVV